MLRLKTIDAHAAGEPLRLIVDGFPSPRGKTMLEKREWVKRHADHLRRALMLEPRGHADMYGAILTEPVAPGLARRRPVHAQRRLQHDVRPRHHRGHDDCARARTADAGRRRHCDRLRLAGRDDSRAARRSSGRARRERVVRERAVVRAARRAGREARRRARFAPTSRSAARSTRSSTAKRSACRSTSRICPSCAASAWRSSTRSRRRTTIAHPLEPGLNGIYGTIFTGPPSDERRRSSQRHDLRRRRSRSIAVRHRHGGGDGGGRRDGPARRRSAVRARKPDRHAIQRPRRRRVRSVGDSTRSFPRSKAPPGSPASTRSWWTKAIR